MLPVVHGPQLLLQRGVCRGCASCPRPFLAVAEGSDEETQTRGQRWALALLSYQKQVFQPEPDICVVQLLGIIPACPHPQRVFSSPRGASGPSCPSICQQQVTHT